MKTFLLLAAGAGAAATPAVTQAAPVAVAPDALGPLYMLVGAAVLGQVVGLVVGFVKWLGTRTVQREDRDKQDLESKLKKHGEELDALKQTLATHTVEFKNALEKVAQMKGAVDEIKANIEGRFDKQGEWYRGQLKEHAGQMSADLKNLEFQLRQDTSRAIHDASTMAAPPRKR